MGVILYKAFLPGMKASPGRTRRYDVNHVYTNPLLFFRSPAVLVTQHMYQLLDEQGRPPCFAEVEALEQPLENEDGTAVCSKFRILRILTLERFISLLADEVEDKAADKCDGFVKLRRGGSLNKHYNPFLRKLCICNRREGMSVDLRDRSICFLVNRGRGLTVDTGGMSNNIFSRGAGTKIFSSGAYTDIVSCGYQDVIMSFGSSNCIVSTKDMAQITLGENCSRLLVSGNGSTVFVGGDDNVIAVTGAGVTLHVSGNGNMVRLSEGTRVTWGITDKSGVEIASRFFIVDNCNVMSDDLYTIRKGELVRVIGALN